MTLKEIVRDPATKFIDVRTEQEYRSGHLANSINIPLDKIVTNLERIKGLGSPAIVFYCRSGNRSGQAVSYLRQSGLQNVYNGGSIEDLNYLLN